MDRAGLPFYKRIVFLIIIPVIIVGMVVSGMLIAWMSPPMVSFLSDQFIANLKLASSLGLGICENHFNYLLDLRLEDNPEMNQAMKNETLEEIKAISRQVPGIHMLVIEKEREVIASTFPKDGKKWLPPEIDISSNGVKDMQIFGKTGKAHVRYFPFWDWRIISFVSQNRFNAPILMSYRIIYLSTLGVFVAVFITLLIALHRHVYGPLRRLEKATRGVMKGMPAKIQGISNNELGRLMTSFNMMVDQLEKEKAEVKHLINQLKVSENRYKTLFENAPVGICLAQTNGDILEINDRMEKTTGYCFQQEKPVNLVDIFEKLKKNKVLSELHKTGRTIENLETTLVCKDGGIRLAHMMMALLDLGVKKVVLAVIQDITDQKKLEEQVQQMGKLEAIGRLAGGVAHDFNNLLSPILGFGELLLTEFDADDRRRVSVEKMIKAGYRARDIVRQLLAFSRKQTLEFKPVQLNTVIHDFQKLLRRTIREDIEIHIHTEPSLPPIKADAGQLEQVIMNLVVNSQDAMPEGGRISITTALVHLDETYAKNRQGVVVGDYVMMAVSDTGCGMSTDIQRKIFDPFFTTKAKGMGTGFGLATVYGIVKQHRGNIWVYSEPGKGATFKIYFPADTQKGGLETKTRSGGVRDFSGNESIFVVEDDEMVCDMTVEILKNLGYRVICASEASECLRLIPTLDRPVELLITDVIMPEMNGRDLFETLSKTRPSLKVLYMSGYTDDVIAHHGVLEKGVYFIQKPFSVKSLAAKVREVLDAG